MEENYREKEKSRIKEIGEIREPSNENRGNREDWENGENWKNRICLTKREIREIGEKYGKYGKRRIFFGTNIINNKHIAGKDDRGALVPVNLAAIPLFKGIGKYQCIVR